MYSERDREHYSINNFDDERAAAIAARDLNTITAYAGGFDGEWF